MSASSQGVTDPCRDLVRLAEGKTKIVFADRRDGDVVLIRIKDAGARKDDGLEGRAASAAATACHVFHLLNEAGMATHFLHKVDGTTFRARRCEMIDLEVVVRRIATGSYLGRFPEVADGTRFQPPLIEFFERRDKSHRQALAEATLIDRGTLSRDELAHVKREALRAFQILERAWARRDVVLVDLEVEFGRGPEKTLLLADVIDNEHWRLWPGGRREPLLVKRASRVSEPLTPEALTALQDGDRWVASKTESFMNTRMGRAVLFRPRQNAAAPSADEAHLVHTLFRELHYIGIECGSVQCDDVSAAVRAYNADGRPLVAFIVGPVLPWLQESVAFPVVYVESRLSHDRSIEDACRRAAWQGARILAVQDASLYGRILGACQP